MVRRKKHLNRVEKTLLYRAVTGLGTVNLMHARYVTQTFAPHFHEGYCLGVIEKGALGFRYMGENLVAPAGSVNLAVPGAKCTPVRPPMKPAGPIACSTWMPTC
jgi:hypothetical protein